MPGRRLPARLVLALGCSLICALLYLLPNRFGPPPIELPLTAIDRAVPFWPASVWSYVSIYLLLPWTFFGLASFARVVALAKALVFTQALAAIVFVNWPIAYPRADHPIPDGTWPLNSALARFVRAVDVPVNCLPSLHVTTVLLCLACFDDTRLQHHRPFATALAIATIASTLTFKQHYIVDLFGGAAIAALAWWLFLAGGRAGARGRANARGQA